MKILFLLLSFGFIVSCDISELEDETGSKTKRGFEYIEAEKNLNASEISLLKEACLSLKLKDLRTPFEKKILLVKRDCDGNKEEAQEIIKYNGSRFEVKRGTRTFTYDSPFTQMVSLESDGSMKSLCNQQDSPEIPRYQVLANNIAIMTSLNSDLASCYYNNNKQGYGENGVCVDVVTAQKSKESSNTYDKILMRTSFVVFKYSGNVRPGLIKYQQSVQGICSNTSSNRQVFEEIYLGP